MLQNDDSPPAGAPRIAFLLGDVRLARHDNHLRLPTAFRQAGWQTTTLDQEDVRLIPAGVRLGSEDPAAFTLLWLLGMGRFHTYLDRMQLLRLLPQHRFVTGVDAFVYQHAKYAWWRHMPETYASNQPDYLKARLAEGGEWVAKPAAGSYGRDVYRIRDDADGRAVIDRLTGAGPGADGADGAGDDRGGYCLLQRFIPAIEHGEKRTLVAGGRLIGSYLRRPADLRANLAAGSTAHPTTLSAGERALVEALAGELVDHGIGFAAVDTVYPYLMEVNLVNPGGLGTLQSLYGEDPTAAVVSALCRWRGVGGRTGAGER